MIRMKLISRIRKRIEIIKEAIFNFINIWFEFGYENEDGDDSANYINKLKYRQAY